MTVFVLDPICDAAVRKLAAYGRVLTYPESHEVDWQEHAEAVVVRGHRVRAEDFNRAKRLRIVAKHGTGVDNIDVAAAKSRNIIVTNTPGANAQAVAEYVVTLALGLARRILNADNDVRSGQWRQPTDTFELTCKTVGLIGLGDVGQRVARIFGQGLRNFIASPHAAGSSVESLERMGLCAAQCVIDVLSGRQPQNAV